VTTRLPWSGLGLKAEAVLAERPRTWSWHRPQIASPSRVCLRSSAVGSGIVILQPRESVLDSPAGFDWGYVGSGPAQLACALLLDYTDDESVSSTNTTSSSETR